MGNIDGPIANAQPSVEFSELARIRDQTREVGRGALLSLSNYRDAVSGGYFHLDKADLKEGLANKPGKPSWASSATVATYLIRTGQWPPADGSGGGPGIDAGSAAQKLINEFVTAGPWESAELPPDNAFTLGFALELVDALVEAGGRLNRYHKTRCIEKLGKLIGRLETSNGSEVEGRVSCGEELPNSYLTDLTTRVLKAWEQRPDFQAAAEIRPGLAKAVRQQALSSMNEQMALLRAERPGSDPLRADVFELGYAVILFAGFAGEDMTPENRSLVREALAAFFGAQRPDGSWPRSRRLFTYPSYGDAYCHDLEFLSRLLRAFTASGNRKSLFPYLAGFGAAVARLINQAKSLPNGGFGWASGHHRAFTYPESWSTAAGFDVAAQIDRLVTDAITASLEDYLGRPRYGRDPVRDAAPFTDKLLDSHITMSPPYAGTLKGILAEHLLNPIVKEQPQLEQGKEFSKETLLSVILYGPPGTSKTTYADAIGKYIGWPMITVDPSHLLRTGFDNIHLEIARLFQMLEKAERVVVFFDEIDELVRDRSAASVGALSRFLTTSMLPQILKLRDSRRVVFVVATNHIETFDPAIARPGRFDLVLPVLPPTSEQKLTHKNGWPALAERMSELGLRDSMTHLEQIESLTYDELKVVSKKLIAAADTNEFSKHLKDAWQAGVLQTIVTPRRPTTWGELMRQQESRIRYPT